MKEPSKQQKKSEYQEKMESHVNKMGSLSKNQYWSVVAIGAKLLSIFHHLNEGFPRQKKLNVLSLACGMSTEYLALKCFYGEEVPINYVGVDINEETNKEALETFKAFSEVKIITGDASNKISLLKCLRKNNISLEGFDLIFLRHPNICNMREVFSPMIENIIPFAASATQNATVFFSTYYEKELDEIYNVIVKANKEKDKIYTADMQDRLEIRGGTSLKVDGEDTWPDAHSKIFTCRGLSFKLETQEKVDIINNITKPLFPYNTKTKWNYASTKDTLWLADNDKELLEKIKQCLEKESVAESICINQIAKKAIEEKPKFCLQIKTPDIMKLLDVKPMQPSCINVNSGMWSANTPISHNITVVANKQEFDQSAFQL